MSHISCPSLHLTPRDISIIEMVYAYRGCGVEHLHARFWPGDATPSASYRRVARLVHEHYLAAHRLPSLTGWGSGKALLTLGHRGRRTLAECRGISVRALPRLKVAQSTLFIHHHFAVCDFRVALDLAAEQLSAVELREWIAEEKLRAAPMKVEDRSSVERGQSPDPIVLIPDGAFVLVYKEREERAFLEMDLGTIAPKRLQRKLRGYLLQQASVPFPVFFVVPDEQRTALVASLTAHEAETIGADPTRIFVAVRDDVRADTILSAPVWQQCGSDRRVAILPSANTPPEVVSQRREVPVQASATERELVSARPT
jgi:Replication-relaxation